MDRMGGMLTRGLGASAENALIFGRFRLKIRLESPVGHGSTPHARPNSDFKNIVDQRNATIARYEAERRRYEEDEELAERNADIHNKRQVTITLSFDKKVVEKQYLVSKKRADKMVKFVKMINKTSASINVVFSDLKRKLHNITFKKS